MSELYIGLMSGTSVDGVDAAIVNLSENKPELIESLEHPCPHDLRQLIHSLCQPGDDEINRLGKADALIGELFAKAANALLEKARLKPSDIQAIGSHGQTIRHHPNHKPAFTLQIGDPNTIALHTGITTVADFRRKDIANGGEGAPFAPLFHQVISEDQENHAIVNIGGIANLSYLTHKKVIGFDTGPGNTLMDHWCREHHNKPYDKNGVWAQSGNINENLLNRLLSDEYFKKPHPKSTGREYFNAPWLAQHLSDDLPDEDVQATLTELTAKTIAESIEKIDGDMMAVLICGGGAHNTFLLQRLNEHLNNATAKSTADVGIDPDWIEAMLFAWLAQKTTKKETVDLTSITGSKEPRILGGVYYP